MSNFTNTAINTGAFFLISFPTTSKLLIKIISNLLLFKDTEKYIRTYPKTPNTITAVSLPWTNKWDGCEKNCEIWESHAIRYYGFAATTDPREKKTKHRVQPVHFAAASAVSSREAFAFQAFWNGPQKSPSQG